MVAIPPVPYTRTRKCIFEGFFYCFQQPVIATTLPDPYGRELKGIAAATGIPLGKL